MVINSIAALRSPGPELLQVGPLILRWYGLLIAFSVLIGLNLSNRLAKKRGLGKNIINDLMPILVLSSVIGARIYYVLFEWDNYSGSKFWGEINIFGLLFPIRLQKLITFLSICILVFTLGITFKAPSVIIKGLSSLSRDICHI